MMFFKIAALIVSWLTMLLCVVCLVWSFALWQVDGIFWYGLGLIVTGLAFRTSLRYFLKD